MLPSALREPSYGDIDACFEHYRQIALNASRHVEITLNPDSSIPYNMARCVWLADELASDSPVLSGWRLSSARRRAFDRFNFTLVPLGRSAGLAVQVSQVSRPRWRSDAAWNIVRVKWLEAQVSHLILSGAANVETVPVTVPEAAVTGAVGPAVIVWNEQTYGVEIECYRPLNISMAEFARRLTDAGLPCQDEGYNHLLRGHWKIVTDGSLNNAPPGHIGMEVVSPILQGETDFEKIRTVSSILLAARCRINKSTGLHVHVGLPRLRNEPVGLPMNVLRLYSHYEKVIDSLMPESRRGTMAYYAQPIGFGPGLARATTTAALRQAYNVGHMHRERYRKVNLEAVGRHGTLEFRQHAGTIEAEKIINWVTLVLKLMATASTAPALPEGPATLSGLMSFIGANDAAEAFWTRRQALLAPANMRAAAD
jgi:hypothetical protein